MIFRTDLIAVLMESFRDLSKVTDLRLVFLKKENIKPEG